MRWERQLGGESLPVMAEITFLNLEIIIMPMVDMFITALKWVGTGILV